MACPMVRLIPIAYETLKGIMCFPPCVSETFFWLSQLVQLKTLSGAFLIHLIVKHLLNNLIHKLSACDISLEKLLFC